MIHPFQSNPYEIILECNLYKTLGRTNEINAHPYTQLPVAYPVETLCCVVRGGRGQAHAVAQFAHACRRDYHRAFGRRGDPPALLAR